MIPTFDKDGPRIAALYVDPNGVYRDLADCWGEDRNAMLYRGPYPGVGHPPCTVWGAYARSGFTRDSLGDDGGTFAACLASIREWGGVIEHPANSSAWSHHYLAPPRQGHGWRLADGCGGYTCYVEQGHYGHACRKPTWLYAVGCVLPDFEWGASTGVPMERIDRGARAATPKRFANILLGMAQSVGVTNAL